MSGGRLGVALIGTGMAAGPHARALRDLADRVDVRGVYSRDADGRADFAGRYGFPAAAGVDALLADDRLDAVILATPPDQRIELIRRCAEAGKHLLSEKPLERSSAAAEQVCALCADAGVRLGVVFQHRFRRAARRLRELLADGALGALGAVRVQVPWWREQSYYDEPGRGSYARDGGGVLISQAIHTLDLALSLAGPVDEVQAVAATTRLHHMESEDFVAAGLRFRGGFPGALTATTAAFPGGAESIALDGERGSALLEAGRLTVRWRDGRTEQSGEETGSGGGADPMAFPYVWHRALIAAFIDALRDGRTPSPDGRDALRVQRLIDALMRSSRERRAVAVPSAVPD